MPWSPPTVAPVTELEKTSLLTPLNGMEYTKRDCTLIRFAIIINIIYPRHRIIPRSQEHTVYMHNGSSMSLETNMMYLQIPEVREDLLELIHDIFVTLVRS